MTGKTVALMRTVDSYYSHCCCCLMQPLPYFSYEYTYYRYIYSTLVKGSQVYPFPEESRLRFCMSLASGKTKIMDMLMTDRLPLT